MDFPVENYGARPGAAYDSTAAFQSAIDACGRSGGGRVTVPPGDFYVDMLTLQDHVEFHLSPGTTLFSLLDRIPEEGVDYEEPSFNMKRFLLGGVKLTDVSITGKGTIDGRGYVKFWDKNDGYEHPLYGQRYWPRTHRPRALIHFRESADVRIEDITLLDPPAYNIWLLGCDRCDISRIRIRTDLHGPNNDGIDIDCCSNVYITGCDIVTNDDAVGIFSDINTLGYDKPCENIVVSDCRIKAVSDGIRIGYVGDGAIRNVTFSNCVIYESMIGISMMVALSPDDCRGVYIKYGPRISNINFSNLVIDAEQTFNFQSPKSGSSRPLLGFMQGVFLRNITATARRGSYFGGVPERPLGTIVISDLDMTLTGEMGTDFLDAVPDPYPVWTDMVFDGIPHGFFIRYAEDFTITGSTLRYRSITGAWHNEVLRCENACAEHSTLRVTGAPETKPVPAFAVDRERKIPAFASVRVMPAQALPEKILFKSWIFSPYPDENIFAKDEEQLKRIFARLKSLGVEKAILPALVWKELYHCAYSSSRYAGMKGTDLLTPISQAAAEAQIDLYCGTCGSSRLLRSDLSPAAFEKELLEHRCALSELQKKENIAGFYCPMPLPVTGRFPGGSAQRISEYLENFIRRARKDVPDRKVILPVVPEYGIPETCWQEMVTGKKVDEIMLHCTDKLPLAEQTASWESFCNREKIALSCVFDITRKISDFSTSLPLGAFDHFNGIFKGEL